MKLLLTIMPQRDANSILDAVMAQGYRATLISSTGGFLRQGSATLMIGVDEKEVPLVTQLLKETCQALRIKSSESGSPDSREPSPCGITLFTLNVEQFEHR